MQKKTFFAGLVLPIMIIAITLAIMNSGFLKISSHQIKEVRIEVSYTGPWKGVIYSNGDVQNVSGFSDKTIRVIKPAIERWNLSFHCKKNDGSANLLRVAIKSTDGIILNKGFSLEPYGKVELFVEI